MSGIVGADKETYLFVNGIKVNHELVLSEHVTLMPVTADFDFKTASKLLKHDIDFAVAALSGRNIHAQLKICADTEEDTAIEAWNAQWDCLLLGALFNNSIMCSLQCDKPVELLAEAQFINITNYSLHGLLQDNVEVGIEDEDWIKMHYSKAKALLDSDNESISNAVHCMSTYMWHTMPRVQLAILWSGIESLFNVATEVSFRVSLCIANFLYPNDKAKVKECYSKVKKLYDSRSAAVHGNKMKGDVEDLVKDSASLLNTLIKKCCELERLPDTKELIFG